MQLHRNFFIYLLASWCILSNLCFAQSDLIAHACVPKTTLQKPVAKEDRNDDGVYVSLRPPTKKTFIAGTDPVWIKAWLERDPGSDLLISYGDPFRTVNITVEMDKKPALMTPYRKFRHGHSPYVSYSPLEFSPTDSHRYAIHLNRLYDLNRPGIYTVKVSAFYRHPDGRLGKVESNTIQIEIVEPKGPTWQVPAPEGK